MAAGRYPGGYPAGSIQQQSVPGRYPGGAAPTQSGGGTMFDFLLDPGFQQHQRDYQQWIQQRRQAARENAAATGSELGIYGWDEQGYLPSETRYDQTSMERVAQQLQHHEYGGYAGGADAAAAAARGAVADQATLLGLYGNQYFGQAQVGADVMGQGVSGLYGQAAALNQYAQLGPGPSVAQAQLDANTAQAMRQQLALAGSGRGAGGGAAAFRQAAANQAQIQGAANAQAALLQAQEAQNWRQAQLAAMQGAGSLYGAGAELGGQYAGTMSDLASQAQRGSGELALSGEQLAHQIYGTALAGKQAYEANLTDIYGIAKGIGKQPDPNAMTTKDWVGLGLQTAGTVGAVFSDIRAKQNIEPASALEAVENANAYSYEYKDPERFGAGRYIGPMAQDLEGTGAVREASDGTKMVDPGRLTMVNTSAIAELNRKVDALAGEGTPIDYNPYVSTSEAPKSPVVDAALKAFGSKAPNEEEIATTTAALRSKYGNDVANEFEAYADALLAEKSQGVTAGFAPRPSPASVDTSRAPVNPGVAEALHSFGAAPSEAEIARKREDLRAQYGSSAANEFERYAMALSRDRQSAPRYTVDIGPAEGIYRTEPTPLTTAAPQAAPGPTQGAAFVGDKRSIDYLQDKYSTPIYGAPSEPAPVVQDRGTLLDLVFGPSIGDQVSDIAEEEYANHELRRLFREPPRQDVAL